MLFRAKYTKFLHPLLVTEGFCSSHSPGHPPLETPWDYQISSKMCFMTEFDQTLHFWTGQKIGKNSSIKYAQNRLSEKDGVLKLKIKFLTSVLWFPKWPWISHLTFHTLNDLDLWNWQSSSPLPIHSPHRIIQQIK